jgi:hypothetical protein
MNQIAQFFCDKFPDSKLSKLIKKKKMEKNSNFEVNLREKQNKQR